MIGSFFDELSLIINESQNTVILGPNGSGKTTLLKLLNRELYIVQDNKSYIKIFDKELWNIQELRTQLGVISQHLRYNYSNSAIGLYVVLSGYYASDGIWQHQVFDSEKLDLVARLGGDCYTRVTKDSMFKLAKPKG